MEPGSPLLALRLGEQCHALEPGRDYLLGSADDCDLRIAGAEPHHARLHVAADGVTLTDLGSRSGVLHNEVRAAETRVQIGDRIAIGDEVMVVCRDDGTATLVPIPSLRQAAAARRIEQVRAAAAALRRSDGMTFADLMAHELRRAPWMAISLALHLLLLLLLWWFTPPPRVGGVSIARLGFDVAADSARGDGPPAPPEVVAEPAEDVVLEDPEPDRPDAPAEVADGPEPERRQPAENPRLAKRRPSAFGGGHDTVRAERDIGAGSFAKQVAALQESGLEIVFVFDSTGSMTRTILDTKNTIVQMLEVLRMLVPDARVGLVTYRDRGRRDEYLVRAMPLALDYWHAVNFVQFIVAEGGGDRPEDVRAGLRAAFQQNWRHSTRRVVVLAGDAPTHREDLGKLLQEVRRFAHDRRSFVHTLITSPDRAGKDTFEQFRRIAAAGNGVCEPIDHHERILQRVLALAFGREFTEDLAAVIRAVERDRDRVDVQSLHLVRKGGSKLARALRQRPVPTTLWNALVRRPRRSTAKLLIDLLADDRAPEHSRHAAAAALQRMLDLPLPPIDAVSGEGPSERRIQRLRTLAARLPH
ncbi:MAG TPA: VWA domain-containing protein [bacterium]|nr:VWA domain-containing protein [bacterium]